MKRKATVFLSLIAVITVILLFSVPHFHSFVFGSSPSRIIEETLAHLNVTDAVLVGLTGNETTGEFLEYTSQSTGLTYSFDPATGRLVSTIKALAQDSTAGTASDRVSTQSVEGTTGMTDEQLRAYALEYAEGCMWQEKIGTFQIEEETAAGTRRVYTIKEYYDGLQTGTKITLSCKTDGTVSLCHITYGEIFFQDSDGNISLIDNSPWIDENTAFETAAAFVRTDASENGYTLTGDDIQCQIQALEDQQFYNITICAMDGEYAIVYSVWVDVHSGEILFYEHTI